MWTKTEPSHRKIGWKGIPGKGTSRTEALRWAGAW